MGQGNTEFCDTRAAWRDLDEEMKERLRGVVVEHELVFSLSLFVL